MQLNESQIKAKAEVEASIIMRRGHLVTGSAGTGKTTLMQEIAKEHHAKRHRIVLTAPTHKAVSVLERKLKAAHIDIRCQTIHSLLSLRPKSQGDRQVFVRAPKAKAITDDIVIIDEASMLDSSMMDHIDRHLSGRAVVFVGDPCQLPPVGERESRSFATMPASHLDTIVRQAEGNPIIAAADILRRSQAAAELDWSWCQESRENNAGVFTPPRNELDAWMKRAFVDCGEFQKDADFCRYLCWRNDRVAEINTRIRRWIHPTADLSMPFIPGEIALIRSPLVIDNQILIATNEEVRVEAIAPSEQCGIATWGLKVITEGGMDHDIHLPRDWDGYRIVLQELADAAKGDGRSWDDYHDFKAAFLMAQQCMALTVHNSQGSTFRFAFLDLPDIRRRIRDNLLEAQQLMYTGATRPSDGLVLVGV
jgi:ATP-dependent exoDNAse (exonuclease V) alpha subunit